MEMRCLFSADELDRYSQMPRANRDAKIRKDFERRFASSELAKLGEEKLFEYFYSRASTVDKSVQSVRTSALLRALPLALFFCIVLQSANPDGPLGAVSLFGVLALAWNFPAITILAVPQEILLRKLYDERIDRYASAHAKAKRQAQSEEDAKRERLIREAGKEAELLFNKFLRDPKLLAELFKEYRHYALTELATVSPDSGYLEAVVQNREAVNKGLEIFGVIGKDYTPANDRKYAQAIVLLDRERDRVKRLASMSPLPYEAISYYQEISRLYLGLHRPGGAASIYDEQMITNDVIAMKNSLTVHGDYHDNSVNTRIDRSVSNVTHVNSALIETGEYGLERVKKEILRIILSADDEVASRVELMSAIPVKESMLIASLEELQEKGLIVISNRESGEVVYRVDRLA